MHVKNALLLLSVVGGATGHGAIVFGRYEIWQLLEEFRLVVLVVGFDHLVLFGCNIAVDRFVEIKIIEVVVQVL